MSRGIKKVVLQGNVVADPVTYAEKAADSKDVVAMIDVAVNDDWTDRETGEKKERVDFFRVKLFKGLARVAQEYVRKGKVVTIIGELHNTRYTDKEGIERFSTEIHADELVLGADPKSGASA